VIAKRSLRAALVRRREAFADRAAASARICASLLPFLEDAAVVSLYWPIGAEVDPRAALEALARRGVVTCLPRVVGRGQPLAFHRWRPGDPLVAGPFGTREPEPTAPAATPDHLVVPLLGFDARGYRLGYGGGFYDRTLARLRATGEPRAIGVAFACQEVDHVPRGRYDQPLDRIVTETGLFGVGAGPA
jgi:5-formyltetrahydrofolate cyclo-ligase